MDKIVFDDPKIQYLNEKLDIILQEMTNFIKKLEADNKKEHHKIFENLDRIDTRITSLKSDNQEDHSKLSKHLDCLNSAFIRYETDGIDKIKILFDSDIDRQNHQDIYGHEFKRLNDFVAKISFCISNLEKKHSEN